MTECIVCLNGFKDPRILPCGHTFCRSCLQQMINTDDLKCPTCKEPFEAMNRDAGKLQRNYTLEQALRKDSVESRDETQGENCREHRKKLTLFCDVCHKLVCSDCGGSAKHNRHKILNLQDAEDKADELLNKVMANCGRLVEAISKHKCSSVGNAIADNQEQIQNLVNKFDYAIRMLENAKEKVLLAAQSTADALSEQESTEEKDDLMRQVSSFLDYIEDLQKQELRGKLEEIPAAEATLKELENSFESLRQGGKQSQSSRPKFTVDEQLKNDIVAVSESAERLLVRAEERKYSFAYYQAAASSAAYQLGGASSRASASFTPETEDLETLLCIGGCYLMKKAVLLDPKRKGWRGVSNMKRGRHDAAAAVWNGKVVVCGGSQTYNSVEVYDPQKNEWTEHSKLLTGRSEHALVNLHGLLYAIGGSSASEIRLDSVERYNADAQVWEQSALLMIPRKQFGAVVLQLGSRKAILMVAGGSIEVDGATDHCEVFSNVTKTWTTVESMKTARKCFAAAAYEKTAFVFGGLDPKDRELNSIEQFDGKTLKWTSVREKMTAGRSSFSAATVNGKVYLVGGCNERKWLDLVECFDPVRTNFSSTTPLPQAVCCHVVASVAIPSGSINGLGATA